MVTERKALYTTTLPSIFPILRSHNSQQMLVFCALVLHRYTNTQFPAVRALFGRGISGEDVVAMVAAVEHGAQFLSLAGCGYSLQQDEKCVKGNDTTGKRTNQISAAIARNCTMCYNHLESIAAN